MYCSESMLPKLDHYVRPRALTHRNVGPETGYRIQRRSCLWTRIIQFLSILRYTWIHHYVGPRAPAVYLKTVISTYLMCAKRCKRSLHAQYELESATLYSQSRWFRGWGFGDGNSQNGDRWLQKSRRAFYVVLLCHAYMLVRTFLPEESSNREQYFSQA